MEAICLQIPTTLVGIDTPTTGYHSDCYGNFTKHLDRVAKLLASLEPMASTPRHSPRKKSSPVKSPLSPQTRLFPEKCIFAGLSGKGYPLIPDTGVPCHVSHFQTLSKVVILHGESSTCFCNFHLLAVAARQISCAMDTITLYVDLFISATCFSSP